MHSPSTESDPCLHHAFAQWQGPLEHGMRQWQAGELAAAITTLSEAIRLSASFHPLFHFLESGLNTELAMHYLTLTQWEKAEAAFDRAIFLHHDNATALAGKQQAADRMNGALQAYPTLRLSAPLTPPQAPAGIHALRRQARAAPTECDTLYTQAIARCEETHLHYHRLAAEPWLLRARCFAAQGEDALARNDIRHGMDLDRNNAELLALSMELAA